MATKQEIIHGLRSKREAWIGHDGEIGRKNFKSGLDWGISAIEMLEERDYDNGYNDAIRFCMNVIGNHIHGNNRPSLLGKIKKASIHNTQTATILKFKKELLEELKASLKEEIEID